jgi:hypothetical protein
MIAITIDVDWSPDSVVDAVMDLFEGERVPVTLFCTNPDTDRSRNSSALTGRYDGRHELALHPNFASVADGEAILRALLKHYPDARGFRAHNGCTGWPIVSAAARNGLLYELECRVFPVDVPPFALSDPKNFIVFVSRFMDSHMLHEPKYRWSLDDTRLTDAVQAPDSLFVMNFHPNIVYYDMLSVEDYLRHRPYYHEPRESDSFLRKQPKGGAKLIRQLLASIDPRYFTTVFDYGCARCLWSGTKA